MSAPASLAELRAAAAAGTAEDAFRLAQALVRAQRMDEAQRWHLRAAEAGHADAQIEYARMRLYGIADAPAPDVAVRWLLRAERAGHPAASELLMHIGVGNSALPRDRRINERLMHAFQADHPPALLTAAIHFGRKPHPDDQALCMLLLERAANRGGLVAAALLAERLAHGEGCEAQPHAAEALWTQLEAHGARRLPDFTLPPPDDTERAPRQLALEDALRAPPVRTLCERPWIAVVDRLFSADECRLLIASAQPHLRDSNTVDPATGQALTLPIRTSSDATFDPVIETGALRMAQLRMAAAAGIELVHAERLTVLRYAPGQEYRPHRDYLPASAVERDGPRAGNRARTICVYLNTVTAGGATAFPTAGVEVTPMPGRAVIFDNLDAQGRPDPDSLHAGMPVRSGEKWLATLWIRERPYRDY